MAAFLVPMAVSLAFGVVFATFITLVLVPTWYLILEDMRAALRWMFGSSGRILGQGREERGAARVSMSPEVSNRIQPE